MPLRITQALHELEQVIRGYEMHRYLSSWEDAQLEKLKRARDCIKAEYE